MNVSVPLLHRNLPRISVITPSFNQATFLRQTIRSVLGQSYPNLQYIIIDGGSTDGSVEIIKEYSDKIAYWVSGPDEGQSDAINKGLSLADGDVVTWLNSDDLLMPGILPVIGQAWLREPDLHLLSAECIRIGPKNEFLGWHVVPRQTKWFAERGRIYIDQPGAFWKKDIISGSLFLDTTLEGLMDHDLWYRIVLLGGKTRRIHKCTAAFRYHPQSKSTNIQKTFQQEAALLRKRYCNKTTQHIALTQLTYRAWKCFDGDYIRQFVLSKCPNQAILNYLKELQSNS